MTLNIDVTQLYGSRPPKHYSNIKVLDLDPLSKGTLLPREIEVLMPDGDGARVLAIWHGFPQLAVNDYVRCRRDTTAAVLIVEGAGGASASDISSATTAATLFPMVIVFNGEIMAQDGEMIWQG